ncbi:uncharacterized protein [Dysidea avara]|uniref:uncharacterized protein isoform X2 n=1 Tax=Dysidea avara TaxID=196820 RepID=UPI00332449E8
MYDIGAINQPTVNCCISAIDGKPVLRVLSQVISSLSTPLMFSLSFKGGFPLTMIDGLPSAIMNASCLDQNCTALFLSDSICEKVYNLTVNVTVSAEDCSNSTVKMNSELIWTDEIVTTALVEVTETRATIVCKLPCFSKDIGCFPLHVWLLRNEKKEKMLTDPTFHISKNTGDPYSYSYPSQQITVSNLTSGNSYMLCVRAYNLTTSEPHRSILCEKFTTIYHTYQGISRGLIVSIMINVTLMVILIVVTCIIYYGHKKYHCYKKNQSLRWSDMQQTHEVETLIYEDGTPIDENETSNDDISLPSSVEHSDSL